MAHNSSGTPTSSSVNGEHSTLASDNWRAFCAASCSRQSEYTRRIEEFRSTLRGVLEFVVNGAPIDQFGIEMSFVAEFDSALSNLGFVLARPVLGAKPVGIFGKK